LLAFEPSTRILQSTRRRHPWPCSTCYRRFARDRRSHFQGVEGRAGYTVAATYAGNDEKAAAFTAETGIKTYKWNVADYDSLQAGIAKVEADLGPIDIVVANAGITRDAPFHKMTPSSGRR
jgi:hypothetical protein